MGSFKVMAVLLAIALMTLTGCGGGGGSTSSSVNDAPAPVTVSMSTVISGNSAVGTVFLAGLTAPDAFGLELTVSMPAGASIASVTKSGVAMVADTTEANGQTVILAGAIGFGPGEVMKINFVNVPAGDVTAAFGIAQSIVFDGGGNPIQ